MLIKTIKEYTGREIAEGCLKAVETESKFIEVTKQKFLKKEDVLGLLNIKDKGDFWKWCRNNKGFDYCDKTKQPIKFIEAYEEYLKKRING